MRIDTDWLWHTTETEIIIRMMMNTYHRDFSEGHPWYPTDMIILGRDVGARTFDEIDYHWENKEFSFSLSTIGHPTNPAECERQLGLLVAEWNDDMKCPREWAERETAVFHLNRSWQLEPVSPAHILAMVNYIRLQGAIANDPNVPEYLKRRLAGFINRQLRYWETARKLMG